MTAKKLNQKIKEMGNSYSQPMETRINSVQQHQQSHNSSREEEKFNLLLQDACPNNGQNTKKDVQSCCRRE
jgi:hypothetical protein